MGGLPIMGCLKGSPADLAGIRYGDILLSINGTPTPSWSAFFQARRQCKGSIVVRVFRQGAEFDVRMVLPEAIKTPREVLEELRQRDLLPRSERVDELAFVDSKSSADLS
jgi:predicted metalloprotease with PDZ domain